MMCMGGPIDGADVRDGQREYSEGAIVQIGIVKSHYRLNGEDTPYWRAAESTKGAAEASVRGVYESRGGRLHHVRTIVGSQK